MNLLFLVHGLSKQSLRDLPKEPRPACTDKPLMICASVLLATCNLAHLRKAAPDLNQVAAYKTEYVLAG